MKHYAYTKKFPQKSGDKQNLIQEQRDIIKKTENFLSHFSINRFLYTHLTQFSEKETINLLETLENKAFYIEENPLYFYGFDYESAEYILKELFSVKSFSELSSLYITKIIEGENILDRVFINNITGDNCETTVSELLESFMIAGNGMNIGDGIPLLRLFEVQKAMVANMTAYYNLFLLELDDKQVYDIVKILG